MRSLGVNCHWTRGSVRSRRSPIGGRRRTGLTGPMQRGEVWFAATPGGDRPVLVLTRDPVADRIGSVVVAALTRTRRGLTSELDLTVEGDGMPTDCVVNFDNIHTLPRDLFRRRRCSLTPCRMAQACAVWQQRRDVDEYRLGEAAADRRYHARMAAPPHVHDTAVVEDGSEVGEGTFVGITRTYAWVRRSGLAASSARTCTSTKASGSGRAARSRTTSASTTG